MRPPKKENMGSIESKKWRRKKEKKEKKKKKEMGTTPVKINLFCWFSLGTCNVEGWRYKMKWKQKQKVEIEQSEDKSLPQKETTEEHGMRLW